MTDYKFGIAQENYLLPILKEKFGETLSKTENKYCSFDFENNSCLIELKSRRCKSDTYPTTMIGANKLNKAKETTKDVYFCFNYTDGLYFHKYDETINYKIKRGGRFDRGRPEVNNYAYIPISQLTKV